jgi:hypothetical protein
VDLSRVPGYFLQKFKGGLAMAKYVDGFVLAFYECRDG